MIGFLGMLAFAPFVALILPTDSDEQLYPDRTLRALQIPGAVSGFGAGIQSVRKNEQTTLFHVTRLAPRQS